MLWQRNQMNTVKAEMKRPCSVTEAIQLFHTLLIIMYSSVNSELVDLQLDTFNRLPDFIVTVLVSGFRNLYSRTYFVQSFAF